MFTKTTKNYREVLMQRGEKVCLIRRCGITLTPEQARFLFRARKALKGEPLAHQFNKAFGLGLRTDDVHNAAFSLSTRDMLSLGATETGAEAQGKVANAAF